MESFDVPTLPDKASLECRVRHFQSWLKHQNANRAYNEKPLPTYDDCPAHLVASYVQIYKGIAPDEVKLMNICTCKKSSSKSGNGAYQGPFAFTLTKSPKDPYSVGDMLIAVRKIMVQQAIPVIRYAWFYEDKGRDENGDAIHPHIHGMYETAGGGRIEAKYWKRYWKIWDEKSPIGRGFRGGYHRPVRSEEKYADYIGKDGGMSESRGLDDQAE